MIKNMKIENIPVEKIKIGDEKFKSRDDDMHRKMELEIKNNRNKKTIYSY